MAFKEKKDTARTEKAALGEGLSAALGSEELCTYCRKNKRNMGLPKSQDYCKPCYDKLLKTRLPWQAFIAALLTLAAAIFGIFIFIATLNISILVYRADRYAADKRLEDAIELYGAADEIARGFNKIHDLDLFYSAGTKTFYKKMKVMSNHSFDRYGEMGETLLKIERNEKAFKNFWIRKLKPERDSYDRLRLALDLIYEEAFLNNEIKEPTYEDYVKKLDALAKKDSGEKIDPYLIELFKSLVAVETGKGVQVRLDHLLKVKELAPDLTWLYNDQLAECYLELGEKEKLLEVCDELLRENRNFVPAYSLKMKTLAQKSDFEAASKVVEEMEKYNENSAETYEVKVEFYRRKGDPDRALELYYEASNEGFTGAELSRQHAILSLLNGKYEDAYVSIDSASRIYYELKGVHSREIDNTAALVGYLFGDMFLYETILDSLEEAGEDLSPNVKDIIEGKKTVEDVFLKGEGDVL